MLLFIKITLNLCRAISAHSLIRSQSGASMAVALVAGVVVAPQRPPVALLGTPLGHTTMRNNAKRIQWHWIGGSDGAAGHHTSAALSVGVSIPGAPTAPLSLSCV